MIDLLEEQALVTFSLVCVITIRLWLKEILDGNPTINKWYSTDTKFPPLL